MTYLNDHEEQAQLILDQLKKDKHYVSETTITIIKNCVKEAYGAGYENGLADEKEITENPITG